jgi:hypothetical protein
LDFPPRFPFHIFPLHDPPLILIFKHTPTTRKDFLKFQNASQVDGSETLGVTLPRSRRSRRMRSWLCVSGTSILKPRRYVRLDDSEAKSP